MEIVKKVNGLLIVKKRSGRYGVKTQHGKWLNGDDKVKILLEEGLITAPTPKAAPEPEPEVAEAATTEEAPVAAEETPATDQPQA